MPNVPQTYATHRRLDPAYHYVLTALLAGLAILAVRDVVRIHDLRAYQQLALVMALFIMAFKLRAYPLKAQDRLIRLEEQLRIRALLPQTLADRARDLRPSQLVALRFAPDEELAGLVQQALDERLSSEAIKQRIKSWRGDGFRV